MRINIQYPMPLIHIARTPNFSAVMLAGYVLFTHRSHNNGVLPRPGPWAPPRFGRSRDPSSLPDLGSSVAAETINRETLKARASAIIHGEKAFLIDALSRCGHGERRLDPGPGRQATEDWAKNPQTLDGIRTQRRDAGKSARAEGRRRS